MFIHDFGFILFYHFHAFYHCFNLRIYVIFNTQVKPSHEVASMPKPRSKVINKSLPLDEASSEGGSRQQTCAPSSSKGFGCNCFKCQKKQVHDRR